MNPGLPEINSSPHEQDKVMEHPAHSGPPERDKVMNTGPPEAKSSPPEQVKLMEHPAYSGPP